MNAGDPRAAGVVIRTLHAGDARSWWRIRADALESEPLAFGTSLEEHCATTIDEAERRFRVAPEGTLDLGAFAGGELVGIATFVRDSGLKERHKGHVYGVFVRPSHRGQGIARKLFTVLLERARRDPSLENILLTAASGRTAAQRLYRGFGFTVYGTEPNALKVGDTYVDEDHMILRLHEPRTSP